MPTRPEYEVPADWGEDSVSFFFETARQNQIATRELLRPLYDHLSAIHSVFEDLTAGGILEIDGRGLHEPSAPPEAWRALFSSPSLRRLAFADLFVGVQVGASASLHVFYVSYVLGMPERASIYLVLMILMRLVIGFDAEGGMRAQS